MSVTDAPIRIGAINYLNAAPLIEGLEWMTVDAEVCLDVPSRLADQLAAHCLDVALIPVIEFFRKGDYALIPGISISSRGPVLSVTLFSHVPWRRIHRIALDEGSRTSAALTQILLRKRYGVTPETIPLPADSTADEMDTDAVLLIGDRAMRACLPNYDYCYDLGQEWSDWTGLPFVYAVWAVRSGVDLGNVGNALADAKRRGLRQLGAIADREAPRRGLGAGLCRRYLGNVLHFGLGSRELAGIRHFASLAAELGLCLPGIELEFYSPSKLHMLT